MTAVATKEIPALLGGEHAVEMPLSNWPIIDETEERWMLELLDRLK